MGLNPSASEQDIKVAYRNMAKKMHPDKGGDTERFKQLQEAYEILRDSNKREIYNRYGKEGLAAGNLPNAASAGFSGDLRDLFRSFASDFQRSVPLLYQLELPLEDFFQGRSLSLELQGERFSVSVEAGMMEGLEIRGRLSSGREVVFALRERTHAVFQRRHADLLMQLEISLHEALFGFECPLRHLDGSQVLLTGGGDAGGALSPGDVLVFPNLGMPIFRAEGKVRQRGRLFVRISIQMPRHLPVLTSAEKEILRRVLGGTGEGVEGTSAAPPSSSSTKASIPGSNRHRGKRGELKGFGGVGAWGGEAEGDGGPAGFFGSPPFPFF